MAPGRPVTDRPSGDSPRPVGDRSPAAGAPPVEPRQRWRIVFARERPDARTHREVSEAWAAAIATSGLPLPRAAGRPRSPLAFAAPLPVGVVALRELADLVLAERLPIADVRRPIEASAPKGIRVVDLFDVWLGAPPLAAAVVAADWLVELNAEEGGLDAEVLVEGCRRLLAAGSIERERARGAGLVRYDLRPLLADVAVATGPVPILRIRTRFDPERGAGRPEEVVAALADASRARVSAAAVIRDRLILAGDEPPGPPNV